MTAKSEDIVDSQLITEYVGFLDSCFDNSFVLQSSILTIKEYAEDLHNDTKLFKKPIFLPQNKVKDLDSSICKISQDITPATPHLAKKSKELKAWGLPYEIARKYETRGITEMFDWQVSCLSNSKVLVECCNLVYSAPTSAGKTLVAEILTIKTILERQKKVLIILPFVSIVREKMFYLQDILSSSGIRVEGFMGAQSPPGGLQSVHVAICTIEKANSLVNRLLDDDSIAELGAVIVDELHLLGDPHRGYILELLLTKIRYVTSKLENVQIQIVGMSATLPNLEVLASWLNAELFITQFRPIPLDEYCLVGRMYYNKIGEYVNTVENADIESFGNDNVLKICFDTIKDGCSVLIFCMTKNRCESLSQNIATSFFKLGCSGNEMGSVLRDQLKTECILEVLEQLKNCPVGLDSVLKSSISFGVAYHHAGLTFDERDIIEGAFKSGAIRVLVATSTLSSGVNLPARRVIIRTPVFQRQPINILTYKQMIGRAGRMGKDVKGESILICTDQEKNVGFGLMMGALQPVKSCIDSEDKFMRAVLEMIASEFACTVDELELYSKCTLLFTQQDESVSQKSLLLNTLDELKNYELIRIQNDDIVLKYVATALGKACLASSMAPNDGLSLFCELQKARQCLVLETDLHLIYLVTPYSVSSQWGNIDWLHLLTLWESLTKAMKRVGELVGVQESFIIRCVRGTNNLSNVQNKMNIHKRFYTALALQDLVNEVPLGDVATKFQCARGFLQSLQQAAATFAGMVTVFCHQLGWKNVELLVAQFQDRLHFGIHSELLELMKLSSLNGLRARSLFNAGYETIASIASGNVNALENALVKAVPFQSEKQRDDDDCSDIRKRNKIKSIWITGCCGMTTREAADNLISEARQYVEREIGVSDIKWSKTDMESNTTSLANSNNNPGNNLSLRPSNEEPILIAEDIDLLSPVPCIDLDDCKEEKCLNLCGNDFKSGFILKDHHEETLEVKIEPNVEADDLKKMYVLENNIFKSSKTISYSTQNQKIGLGTIVMGCSAERDPVPKDEVIWDSLNINETTLNNVTRNRFSDKIFSPDISFSDGDFKSSIKEEKLTLGESISNITSKDISLFSSDGDNSSLFEDSLPIDLIPSRLLDDRNETSKTLKNEETTIFTVNTNSILKAFQSTIEIIDEDEDIKLIYDDDKNSTPGTSSSPFDCNRIKAEEATKEIIDCQSPYKRPLSIFDRINSNSVEQPIVKKIKREKLSNLISDNDTEDILLNCPKSESLTLNIGMHKLKYYVFRENDVVNNIHKIAKIDNASLFLDVDTTKLIPSNEIIGKNIIKPTNTRQSHQAMKSPIKSITIYFDLECVFFYDLTSLSKTSLVFTELSKWFTNKKLSLKLLSSKFTHLNLIKHCQVELSSSCFDISLAEWLVNSDEKEPTVTYLAKKYCDIDLSLVRTMNSIEKICIKTWAIWKVAEKQQLSLFKEYHDIQRVLSMEIQVSRILAQCEYYGLTVDKNLASQLLADVNQSQETIKKKAFQICGHHFNFNSSKDVAKILGIYRGRKVSTKKSVLTTYNSPISSAIIFWRKLNSILTKTLYPLTEKALIYSEGNRVNPSYTMYTCTGRICMHEPNLQNVPRTFSIPLKYLQENSEECDDVIEFNCRNIFKASPGYILVSADYCQLEMRILTHYCNDDVLTKIMSSDVDVFKSIAASWGSISEDNVDDDLRQKAKQLCYGIIYGMGNKTLGQMLDVTEMEAAVFMDTFHKTYPAIKVFTNSVIEVCRQKGYIETLMKRRRYLPEINNKIYSKKNSAERQAVNTIIQGSAADIAKSAMCEIDNRIHKLPQHNKPRLILQMHDELIYEVPQADKHNFVSTLKHVMENTVQLKVPLPVKVKSGPTWGALVELKT